MATVAMPSVPSDVVLAPTVYESESGYTIASVVVAEARFVGAREDETAFKVLSQRVVDVDGRQGAGELESVWRTYGDFRALHARLCAAVPTKEDAKRLSAEFPAPRSAWLRPFSSSDKDFADLRRCMLENYLKAVSTHPILGTHAAFLAFLRPSERMDWPSAVGAIDLSVHDRPHASSATEWWYYNAHWTDADGKEYSAFAAFFRIIKHTDKDRGTRSYAHALNWALTDVSEKAYYQEVVLDKDSPAVVKKQLEQGDIKDPRLMRAYMEMCEKEVVPLPDRMFSKGRDAVCSLDTLYLDFESAVLEKDAQGRYILNCTTPDKKTGVEMVFTPQKAPVRHGLDGVVKGHDGDDMFYYCIPRCKVSGFFTVNGVRKPIASGSGWYDHEFGGVTRDEEVPLMNYAWNWAAIQLDNTTEVSVAVLVDPRSKPYRLMESRAVVIAEDGSRTQPSDLVFEELNSWTSVRTFSVYPTKWRVTLASAGIDLLLEAPFDDQEFVTIIARPGFWEGRVTVSGTVKGEPVRGVAYVERNGFTPLKELDGFFKLVGAATRESVRRIYPDRVDEETAVKLIASEETPWYVDGVDLEVFRQGIVEPMRYICDQGGKSWRSYGVLACIEVVGGDSRKFVPWLAMPEFMHVGSLIIDDIQDKSLKRRGTDCAHIKYGQAVAINAGTAAYFQAQPHFVLPHLSDKQMNRTYDLFFAALRAGHAGQALDIAGLDHIMDDVIERQDGELAEKRVVAIHRLKTAVPAATLARMGAIVGGGTERQIEAVGRYYESIGIAFQIMDDVLNLTGIRTSQADIRPGVELKTLGEDITAGKVTFPVVKAISRLPKAEMRALWDVIKTKPEDRAVVERCIQILEDCGAIKACVAQATELVDGAFRALDPEVPDSFAKVMLRAFGWYVTERTK